MRRNPRDYSQVDAQKRWTLMEPMQFKTVNSVEPAWFGEAMRVGFRKYDEILTINGVDMEDSPEKIREYIRSRPEEELTFVVKRGKPEESEAVTLVGSPQYIDRTSLDARIITAVNGHDLDGKPKEVTKFAQARTGQMLTFKVLGEEPGEFEMLKGMPKKVNGYKIVMENVLKTEAGEPARHVLMGFRFLQVKRGDYESHCLVISGVQYA